MVIGINSSERAPLSLSDPRNVSPCLLEQQKHPRQVLGNKTWLKNSEFLFPLLTRKLQDGFIYLFSSI